MEKIKIYRFQSFAKINWYLRIGQLRGDGYHNIQSIMQLISLHDTIDLYFPKTTDEIYCNYDIPSGDGSLLGRLFHLVRELCPQVKNTCFGLKIEKHIPPASGLGGASSNAATILKMINQILNLGFCQEKLIQLSATLGSDIPFFASGYPFAVIRGRGDRIDALSNPPRKNLVLVFPHQGVNTGWAYQEWDRNHQKNEPICDLYVDNFIHHPELNEIENIIWNDFETIVFRHYPEIKSLKQLMEKYGCLRVFMSGSGSSMIGTVAEDKKVFEIVKKLQRQGINAIGTTTKSEECSNHVMVYYGEGNKYD